MRIMGIDPGYAIVGWGVLNYERGRFTPLDFGAVTTLAGTPFTERLQQIYNDLTFLLEKHTPDALAI